jgi:hypothetical protein
MYGKGAEMSMKQNDVINEDNLEKKEEAIYIMKKIEDELRLILKMVYNRGRIDATEGTNIIDEIFKETK